MYKYFKYETFTDFTEVLTMKMITVIYLVNSLGKYIWGKKSGHVYHCHNIFYIKIKEMTKGHRVINITIT